MSLRRNANIRPAAEAYSRALIKHARHVLSGGAQLRDADDWEEIVNALKSTSRVKFLKCIYLEKIETHF